MISVDFVKIAWFGKHFGEEPPLVGKHGSGAIFFTGCNLRCVYCQNYQISQQNIGKKYKLKELAGIMINLQKEGALNVNLVSPTVWAEQIKESIREAKKKGLKIPVIWNTNAYESEKLIKGLKGLVDIYLPDFKYGDNETAFKYSGAKNYVEKAKESIEAMFEQVGNLKMSSDFAAFRSGHFDRTRRMLSKVEASKDGTAQKGIIIRHLILPDNIENSKKVLEHIREIDKNIYISLMTQYEPLNKVNKAKDFPEINRRINRQEFEEVYNHQLALGLNNGWVQEMESSVSFLPDFNKENPFN